MRFFPWAALIADWRSLSYDPGASARPRFRGGGATVSSPNLEVQLPVVRPFRALRYAADAVPDLGAVIAPPYDVIGDRELGELLARDARNVVRLDFPAAEPGDRDPDDRYRRAGRLLGAWRGDGTIHQDPVPAVYVYDQQFRRPGTDEVLARRGFFARVGLEPFGAGVRAHERTLSGPREDRYRLLRATNVNTSPVVAIYEDPGGRVKATLDAITATRPTVEAVDSAGEQHRLWMVPAGTDGRAEVLCDVASSAVLTIADGHHRYETALRYRDERRVGAPSGMEAGFDFVLMLLLEPGSGPLEVVPTHRVVRGLGGAGTSALLAGTSALLDGLARLFDIRAGVTREELLATFGTGSSQVPIGGGRFGLWTRDGGFELRARRAAFDAILPAGGAALRRLDVTLLGAALEAQAGLDAAAIAGGALAYTKDAAEAIALVDAGTDGADAAFLLDGTPAAEIIAVATDGDVMPQKSTYIYPKAITGLVINPLEG